MALAEAVDNDDAPDEAREEGGAAAGKEAARKRRARVRDTAIRTRTEVKVCVAIGCSCGCGCGERACAQSERKQGLRRRVEGGEVGAFASTKNHKHTEGLPKAPIQCLYHL